MQVINRYSQLLYCKKIIMQKQYVKAI